MRQRDSGLGRFGTEAEFNNLYAGRLVWPRTSLGLRPTFSTSVGSPGSGGFFASPHPSLSTINTIGFDWLTHSPDYGTLVFVPGDEPVNIIVSEPYLISAPVQYEPFFPDYLTREAWIAGGLDPAQQAPLWQFEQQYMFDLQTNLRGDIYRYTQNGQVAEFQSSLPYAQAGHTFGLEIEQAYDFVQVRHHFTCVNWDAFMLPAGQYVFRIDFHAIPRAMAYECSQGTPLVECYRNRHLSSLPSVPTASIDVMGVVPVDFRIPRVVSMTPTTGPVGTEVLFSGELLGRTQSVDFSPSIPADFSVVSEGAVTANVPNVAATGRVVVKTARGWVIVEEPFVVDEDRSLLRNEVLRW